MPSSLSKRGIAPSCQTGLFPQKKHDHHIDLFIMFKKINKAFKKKELIRDICLKQRK